MLAITFFVIGAKFNTFHIVRYYMLNTLFTPPVRLKCPLQSTNKRFLLNTLRSTSVQRRSSEPRAAHSAASVHLRSRTRDRSADRSRSPPRDCRGNGGNADRNKHHRDSRNDKHKKEDKEKRHRDKRDRRQGEDGQNRHRRHEWSTFAYKGVTLLFLRPQRWTLWPLNRQLTSQSCGSPVHHVRRKKNRLWFLTFCFY